jgi:hypothetical protein
MAPMLGPTRAELIKILRSFRAKKKLPLTLATQGTPAGLVTFSDGIWRLKRLVMNEKKQAAEYKERKARGDNYYVPEMTWKHLEPKDVLVEARSKKEFIALIMQMDWPFD